MPRLLRRLKRATMSSARRRSAAASGLSRQPLDGGGFYERERLMAPDEASRELPYGLCLAVPSHGAAQIAITRAKLLNFNKSDASPCNTLANKPCVVQPDGWARGEREGYGEPRDVTSLSLTSLRIPLVLAP